VKRVASIMALCVACGAPPGVEAPHRSLERVLTAGCSTASYDTIQKAIDASAPGDVVEVCAGTWRERLRIAGRALTLRSADGAAATVIDAEGGGRPLTIEEGSSVVVEGFTIRNGAAVGIGGNVRCVDSVVDLRDSVLEGGSAERGGGFGTFTCAGIVRENTFQGNHATVHGGGLYAEAGLELVENTFEANHADAGGGAYIRDSASEIRDNAFVANTSEDDGGGFFVFRGSPLVQGNRFDWNESGEEGGGLRVKSAEASIIDNEITNNYADWRGGGAKISHDEVFMCGNHVAGNTARVIAGGALLFESASVLTYETYVDNQSDKGAGLTILEGWGPVVIEDSRFEHNEADELGGHLYVDLPGFDTVLRRVELVGGVAEAGGAVYATSASAAEAGSPEVTGVVLENTRLEGNVASASGGALALHAAHGEVRNALFVGNEAPAGAALSAVSGSDLEAINTIFTESRGGAAVHADRGVAPSMRYDDFYDNDGDFDGVPDVIGTDGNLDRPPGFVDADSHDYRLMPGSPLVDAGDPGLHDPDGTRSDIGAHGGPASR
jgi:predicted outer membrane repeat protein